MHITMASLHKPKVHEATNPRAERDEKTEPKPATKPETTAEPAKTEPATAPAVPVVATSDAAPEPIIEPAAPARTSTKTEAKHTPAPEPVTSGE